MNVSVAGVKRIVVTKLASHPNDGVWLSLEGDTNDKVWVTLWIPINELAIQLSELAGILINAKPEERIEYTMETRENASGIKIKTS